VSGSLDGPGSAPSSSSARAAAALVARLLDCGVTDVALCPGSRSAPLAYALEAAERAGAVRLHVRSDERTAAFVALGCARADPSRPAAAVTTSGTAAGHLVPAAMEAHHSGVPLLLLTADRPLSLRGTWANQTTHLQAGIFAEIARQSFDLAAPGPGDEAGWARAAQAAVEVSTGAAGGPPGPVHLNLAFEEPLVPAAGDLVVRPDHAGQQHPLPRSPGAVRPTTVLARGPRTVVVAGDGAGGAAAVLAAQAGWPLLAEPTSGSRTPAGVPAYRQLLDRADLGGRVQRVVVLGRPTLSRPVTRLLARDDVEVVQVVQHAEDPGPGRPVTRVLGRVVCSGDPARPEDERWSQSWRRAGDLAQAALGRVLDAWPELTGPALAGTAALATGPRDVLVVAASNPVRDLDLMAPGFPPGALVLANRGLAGIDGTLSTAVGVACASGRTTRALVGDLAFLHDAGGLAVPARELRRLRLQVLLLNDDGGGIFSTLEHADQAGSFERVFGTPHGTDFATLCAAHGVPHKTATGARQLAQATAAVPQGISVIEVRTSRAALRDLHAALRSCVEEALA